MRVWQLHGSDAADLRFHRRRCSTKSNEAEGYDDDGDRRFEGGARVLRRPFALHDRDHRQLVVRAPIGFHVAQHRHPPRKRASMGGLKCSRSWIPAFAGMTGELTTSVSTLSPVPMK